MQTNNNHEASTQTKSSVKALWVGSGFRATPPPGPQPPQRRIVPEAERLEIVKQLLKQDNRRVVKVKRNMVRMAQIGTTPVRAQALLAEDLVLAMSERTAHLGELLGRPPAAPQ